MSIRVSGQLYSFSRRLGQLVETIGRHPDRPGRYYRRRRRLAEVVLVTILVVILIFLVTLRPPVQFYALLMAPVTLAAVLYEFVGGTLVGLAAVAGAALLIALDPDATRRGATLQEAWPLLLAYLATGPLVGWLSAQEREQERNLISAAKRLHVAQEIAQAINTSLDLQDTLQTIIAETRRLIAFEQAAILLREGDMIRVMAVRHSSHGEMAGAGKAYRLEGSAVGRAMQRKQIWSMRATDIGRYSDGRLLCLPEGACLVIPLLFQRTAIGAFVLSGRQIERLPDIDREHLKQIAGQTAVAIEHARLYQLERERGRALAAISDAGNEIAASLDLARTLRLVMKKAAETLPMDAGALFRFDDQAQLFRVEVSHNLSPDHVAQITFAFEEGVPGWVVKQRQPLIVGDAAGDARVHPHVVEDGVQSVMAIPMIARERVVGVLNLYRKTGARAFDDSDLQLAQVYADQAAVFVENARLVKELRQAATELEARVKRRTSQLRETQSQVIRAEKMAAIGRLATSVAHEVNNPLQAITLHLQLIAEESLSPGGKQDLVIVQQELGRIAQITQRLLEFQRPTHGQVARHPVAPLLEDVLALASQQLRQTNIQVRTEIAWDVGSVKVVGDQLKQVFLNLVLNAIQAMPDGGDLTIRAGQAPGTVWIAFSDTGTGMTEDVMAQLFEPFFTTRHQGSGLGLAVSHEILARHQGRLQVESSPGEGSTFTVTLPAGERRIIKS